MQKSSLISEIYARTMKNIVDGEILVLLFEQAGREEEPYVLKNRVYEVDDKDYMEMVSKKTASLFQACCEVGAICANTSKEQLEALRSYGFYVGLAFQVRDNTLDILVRKKFLEKGGKGHRGEKIGKSSASLHTQGAFAG